MADHGFLNAYALTSRNSPRQANDHAERLWVQQLEVLITARQGDGDRLGRHLADPIPLGQALEFHRHLVWARDHASPLKRDEDGPQQQGQEHGDGLFAPVIGQKPVPRALRVVLKPRLRTDEMSSLRPPLCVSARSSPPDATEMIPCSSDTATTSALERSA